MIESGEKSPDSLITATAVRELREETGLIVDPAHLTVAGIIHGAWGVEAPNGFLTIVFVTHAWNGDPVNAEPHKHSQVTWFPTDQVPSRHVPTTREALMNYLHHGPMVSTAGF